MAYLSIELLGGFHVNLDGVPVEFRTQKSRALLAYLAAEGNRAHSRAYLAGLLWPAQPDGKARAYLRQALVDLRKSIDDFEDKTSFLRATNQTLQLGPQADCRTDVARFRASLTDSDSSPEAATDTIAALAKATGLYRGRFLAGFFLKGCREFEEWQLFTAEMLQRQTVDALSRLTAHLEAEGDPSSALRYAWRVAELEPLSDDANRCLIRVLAASGDAAAALAHYRSFAERLNEDLETTPAPETRQLADRIAAGHAKLASTRLQQTATRALPPFLPERSQRRPQSPFVARAPELARFDRQLETAIAGNGTVLFVAGDAGQGKTALIQTFARQAVAQHEQLVAVRGRCSNFQGLGDPYLPFREMLAQLSGDFVAQWEAGELNRELALRLWRRTPQVVDALLDQGPDLVGTLVPETGLATRVAALEGSRERGQRLEQLQQRRSRQPKGIAQQNALFDQCTRVLQTVARLGPLLLILDDLHWMDLGSLALLFHLSQRLPGCRILVVCAYRPEEVALGQNGAPHPLEPLIAEFQQTYSDCVIDLNDAGGRDFVDAYLDLEPNRFSVEFCNTLYEKSGGHPLFTIELLRELRAGGALGQDNAGFWFQAGDLDWQALPPRVEATIGRRIRRLPSELRVLLEIAAVQGNEFSVDVVAEVLDERVTDVLRAFREMERRHRLVVPFGHRRSGGRRIVYYRFEHMLFRQYIYDRLDDASRVACHAMAAAALEALYANCLDEHPEIVGRLSWHFQEAEQPGRAAPYCTAAGQAAERIYAYDEALVDYNRGLVLIDSLPEGRERDALELNLLIGFGAVRLLTESPGAPGLAQTWRRAHHLCGKVGDSHQRFKIARYEWEMYFVRGEMRSALRQAERCLNIAQEIDADMLECHVALGPTLYRLGEMRRAQHHFEQALALCTDSPAAYISHVRVANPMVNVRVNGSIVLWYLGYPDRASQQNEQGITEARSLNHPYSLAFALVFSSALYQRAAMPMETEECARQVIELSAEHGFALWSAVCTLYSGWARVAQGDLASGIEQTEAGLAAIRATGMEHIRYAAVLADAYLRCGEIEAGLAIVEELLAAVARTDEREWEAELFRLKGELLLARCEEPAVVEACFEQAVAVAKAQEAKSLELRATVSLARFLKAHGRRDEARQRLATIYEWFTEDFDTPDLVAAVELLSTG